MMCIASVDLLDQFGRRLAVSADFLFLPPLLLKLEENGNA